jgi:hypothetical protein
VCMSICLCVCLSGYTFLHLSTDLLQIWSEYSTGHDTLHGLYIYVVCTQRVCACQARACVYSLTFEQSMSKCAGNILRLAISGKDYVLMMFTHCAHACERACARSRVITH